jgi:DNA repair protein RecN (Recombination protein N)
MLKSLFIRNYALIDELEMQFGPGLTILSGETGAGKSIILGALDLITGKRADTSVLMDREKKCVVEAEFDIRHYGLQDFFREEDLDYEEITTVRREISPAGKSRAFINDTPVRLNVLQQLGSGLIDVHSQHQGLLLSSGAFQMKVLDAFTGREKLLEEYRRTWERYRTVERNYTELLEISKKAVADLDYYRFQYEELEKADLREGEQEELEQEVDMLEHAGEIKNVLLSAWHSLLEDENGAVVSRLKEITASLGRISSYLPEVKEYLERVESASIDLKDLADELEVKGNDVEYDPARAEEVRERLNLIWHLEEKHRVPDLAGLLQLQEELAAKIGRIASYDEEIAAAEKELAALKEQVWALGEELTEARSAVREKIEGAVVSLLHELGIPAARFIIDIQKAEEPGPYGFDRVSFLFSANAETPPREVGKVASGGELSRLMLSLKSLLTETSGLPTIIFDEIDTGISGDIADRAGGIIARMGEHMQVINITHLPQIASKGKDHYLVYKTDENGKTRTHVKKLSPEERVTEIAKLLSGRELTEAAFLNARELLGAAGRN